MSKKSKKKIFRTKVAVRESYEFDSKKLTDVFQQHIIFEKMLSNERGWRIRDAYPSTNNGCPKQFCTSFLDTYVPPPSWKEKMEQTDLQADLLRPNTGATDPITGAPTNVTFPQPISEDIDLLDRKPCQGGTCETYLIKDKQANASTALPTIPVNATPVVAPPPNVAFARPCCNQMPLPQPCLALACPPPSPMPACNPNCRPHPNGMWPTALYRRGNIAKHNWETREWIHDTR